MKNYIDLISKLPKTDIIKMENYINKYGVSIEHYMGTEKWLQNWSHSNQNLYKLLGESFIHTKKIEFAKSSSELSREILDELFSMPFKEKYHIFYQDYILPLYEDNKITNEEKQFFNHLFDMCNILNNKIAIGIKYRREGCDKLLQIQKGSKPMKACQKVIDYFKGEFDFEDTFEEFRLKHSLILNDKILKGELCFSIHPLDYMTMSDNGYGWSSCMSWTGEGCYRVGTIEMMNSNNVICCYLRGGSDYYFSNQERESEERENYTWRGNKRWRNLAYVTKDIIMSGKSYPYSSKELSTMIITELRDLAKKNLGWTYTFGPEEYNDMKYINSLYTMNRAREYRWDKKNNFKHNIIWDTKGMYNDMLNDSGAGYLCFRNKVKNTKIISVSGKAPCLCCGEQICTSNFYDMDDSYDAYNERYYNCGDVICEECASSVLDKCNICKRTMRTESHYISIENPLTGEIQKICKDCFQNNVYICPCCGKKVYIGMEDYDESVKMYGLYNSKLVKSLEKKVHNEFPNLTFYQKGDFRYWNFSNLSYRQGKVEIIDPILLGLYICKECAEKEEIKPLFEDFYFQNYWDSKLVRAKIIDIDSNPAFEEKVTGAAIKDNDFKTNIYNNNYPMGKIVTDLALPAFMDIPKRL